VDRFSTFDELQSHLVWVVRDASRRYVEFWHTRLDDNARGVLDSLCRYIAGLSPDAVQDVTPLPYRRPLADAEMWAIWHRVSARWGLPSTPPASFDEVSWRQAHCDLLVTDVETFDRAVPPRTLRSLLGNMGVTRIWKLDLTQEGWSSEMDLAYVDTRCDWGECYLVALDLGWIMYVSHEAEFVAAGPTLLKRIRAAWNA
jgi:hypothetical protein